MTVTISKSLRKYLSNKLRKEEIKELQKAALLDSAHTHTVESANVKVRNIFQGQNNSTFNTNCNYRTAATLYT